MVKGIAYRFTIALLAVLCIVGLYFDFFYQPAADDTSSMSLRFSWVGIPACASTSPPFQLGNVPAGTKSLSFMMTDLNATSFHHVVQRSHFPETTCGKVQLPIRARVHRAASATIIAGPCRHSMRPAKP
jgi:hypothetical protein